MKNLETANTMTDELCHTIPAPVDDISELYSRPLPRPAKLPTLVHTPEEVLNDRTRWFWFDAEAGETVAPRRRR